MHLNSSYYQIPKNKNIFETIICFENNGCLKFDLNLLTATFHIR